MSSIDEAGPDAGARVRALNSDALQTWSPYDIWRTRIFEPRRRRLLSESATVTETKQLTIVAARNRSHS